MVPNSSSTRIKQAPANSGRAVKDRHLLWTCFIVVVLLGPLLTTAYILGRMAAPGVGHAAPQTDTGHKATSQPTVQPTVQSRAEAPAEVASPAQSALHGTYLQVGVGPHPRDLIERLRKSGFSGIAIEVPGRPGLRRVLVGPLQEGSVADIRAELNSKGLPGDSAISKVF